MKGLTCRIHLLQPLLVTQLGAGEENSATTYNFIPGSVLHGALASRYIRQKKLNDPLRDQECRRLFFDRSVCYLNAYLADRHSQGERSLPKPLSWRVQKDEKSDEYAEIHDWAIHQEDELENPAIPSGEYFWWDEDEDDSVALTLPKRYIQVHNASDTRMRKAQKDSTVYRYEALAAKQVFVTAILAEDREILEKIQTFLNNNKVMTLGGSRSAGYGLVRFEVDSQINPEWREYQQNNKPYDKIVVLTLLSDTILRNEDGQPTTDLDEIVDCKNIAAFKQVRVIGGFNRKWGLPLVQVPALRAGSVFVYSQDEVDQNKLNQWVEQGIGERRAEGFGRIAINLHTQEKLFRTKFVPQSQTQPVRLSASSRQMAQRMAQQLLRARLEEKMRERLSTLEISGEISNTQLSRLRQVVLRAWRENNLTLIPDHLKRLKSTARTQFERARVGEKRFLLWLQNHIIVSENNEIQNKIWNDWLEPNNFPTVAGVTAEASQNINQIKVEYTCRFLDALLKKTLKQNNE